MKKFCFLSLLFSLFLISCGSSPSNQNTDNQTIKEVTTLDSLNNELEATIQEIDKSETDLDAALEELDD